jgi:hypothetical protein
MCESKRAERPRCLRQLPGTAVSSMPPVCLAIRVGRASSRCAETGPRPYGESLHAVLTGVRPARSCRPTGRSGHWLPLHTETLPRTMRLGTAPMGTCRWERGREWHAHKSAQDAALRGVLYPHDQEPTRPESPDRARLAVGGHASCYQGSGRRDRWEQRTVRPAFSG